MRKKIYLTLGLIGLINAGTNNPIGLILGSFLGTFGSSVGDIFSGTAIIFLLLSWYSYRKEKLQSGKTESKISKYTFWTIVIVFSATFFYVAIYGFLNILSS